MPGVLQQPSYLWIYVLILFIAIIIVIFFTVRNIADRALFHSASPCWCCDPLGHRKVTVCSQTGSLAPPSDCGLISPHAGADALTLIAAWRLAGAPVLVPSPSGRWVPHYSGEMAVAIELKWSFLSSKEMKTAQDLLVSELPTWSLRLSLFVYMK